MKKTKRFLSGLLAVALAFTMLPMSVFAKDSDYCYDSENVVGSCRLTAQAKTDGVLTDLAGGTVIRKNTDAMYFDCFSGVWTFNAVTNSGYKFVGWETNLLWEQKVLGHFEGWKWISEHWVTKSETNPEKICNNKIDDHINNKNGNYAFHEDKTHMAIHHVGCSAQSVAFIRNVHYNIIAKFVSDSSVTFESNGGSPVEKMERVKPNSKIKAPKASIKKGYNFMGWYKEPTLQNKWAFDTDTVTGNITLYAKWNFLNKTYGVYHYSPYAKDGEYDTQFEDDRFGKSVLTEADIKDLVKESAYGVYNGYDLWGYKPNDSTQYQIASKYGQLTSTTSYDVSDFKEMRLHIVYNKDKITHTVTFDTNGGSTVSPVNDIRNNSTIKAPEASIKKGYTFMGWYKERTLQNKWTFDTDTVTGNITLYAKWDYANKTYGVYHYSPYAKVGSYDVEFANNKFDKSEITDAYIKSLVNETQYGVYEGYVLWGYEAQTGELVKVATKDTPVTIKDSYDVSNYRRLNIHLSYKENVATHTVTFDTNGGSTVEQIKVTKNAKIPKPSDPTRYNSIFKGWYKEQNRLTAWDFGKDTVTKDITLFAKWETSPDLSTSYAVEYYKDSISDATKLATSEQKLIKLGETVTLSQAELDAYKPAGYLSGVIQNASTTITMDNRVIKVLYRINDDTRLNYSVSYYINGTIVPNLEYYGSVPLANPIVNSGDLRGEGSEGLHGKYLKGCLLEKTIPATPFTVVENDVNIGVYYNTSTTDVLPVTHQYYLNGVLQSSLTTSNNEALPPVGKDFSTNAWHKAINGYSYSGISIKGVLKSMFVEEKAKINAFNIQLDELQTKLTAEKAKVENADALITEYNTLLAKLSELVKKPAEEKLPAEPKAPTAEAPAEELPKATEAAPLADTTAALTTAPVETASQPTTPAVAEPKQENKAPVDESIAVKARIDEIKVLISSILDIQNQIDAINLEKAAIETKLNDEIATHDASKPLDKEISSTLTTFSYDSRYNYTVTINYTKTVSSGNTDNNNNNNNNSSNNYVNIPEPEVPLAQLPDDVVTIVDTSVPLGKLPKAGGIQASTIGGAAFMALMASLLLKFKRKKD